MWETINVLVMILGMTLVSSTVIGGGVDDLLGYVGLGIIIWTTITSLITEGAATFTRNANLITCSNVSVDCYIGKTVLRTTIIFCHHILLYVFGLLLGFVPLTWTVVLAVPGLALLFVNAYSLCTTLAFLCARYRDIEPIIRNLLQLAFFVTPVFWNHEIVEGTRRAIIEYNPFFYFIEIIRAPLLGHIPPLRYYAVAIACTLAGYAIAFLVYRRMRRELAFFV